MFFSCQITQLSTNHSVITFATLFTLFPASLISLIIMAEIPPGPTLTKGLDFSSNKIGNRDVSSADAVYKRAVEIINEKLPLMSELNALLAVNLGDGKPLIATDARLDDAKLVDLGVREPDTKITSE